MGVADLKLRCRRLQRRSLSARLERVHWRHAYCSTVAHWQNREFLKEAAGERSGICGEKRVFYTAGYWSVDGVCAQAVL
jgi:hypothetical protein